MLSFKDLELLPVPQATAAAVAALVERYALHRDQYHSSAYNEAQVRQEFINPFFTALGWDMDNKRGYSEANKEVIHEDTVRVGGVVKAPDYCFRWGGQRKFYVEAKAPAVNLKADTSPAYQLRRYGWSAKLPLSVLTDFEEFAIYDCRVKPAEKDPPALARVGYLTYDQYLDNLPLLYSIFACEAIPKGFFDRYAEGGKGKRGTSTVDAEFLKEIERWRDELARAIARHNTLSVHELNYAVQTIIDRILFLRIAEDRGVERDEQLKEIAGGPHLYADLCKAFADADEKYNSGLFDFSAKGDHCTPGLEVDSRVLKDIIASLYYPRSPYEFSVIGADILGAVYEQFLGKVIRLTPAGLAKVEEKPEVKKAGGVYYTPRYIVDYIVEHTVGEAVREAGTPKKAAQLRLLDPACGSGSFLLGAYDWLLNWHLQYYVTHDPDKQLKARRPVLVLDHKREWRLSTAERKRILLDNLYGVDIDPQAVEVTKLNLLLKCLEGETEQSLQAQQQMFHERVLPNIDGNIKCGNSLIGPDYYTARLDYDEEEQRRVNAFDWQRQFPEIMKAGGFDCVIGNPPYIRMETFKDIKWYLRQQYRSHDDRTDIYAYFIERGLSCLRPLGRFGMIVSNKFIRANYGRNIRNVITNGYRVDRITDFAGLPVFVGATVRTIVLLVTNEKSGNSDFVYTPPLPADVFRTVQSGSIPVSVAADTHGYHLCADALDPEGWRLAPAERTRLLNRLQSRWTTLGQYADGAIWRGVVSGLTEAFVIDGAQREDILVSNPEAEEIIKPHADGREIRRYSVTNTGRYLIYTYHGVPIERYPAVEEHLRQFKQRLEQRATQQKWYELQQPQFNFSSGYGCPKIIFPDIATAPRFALDSLGHFGSNTTYCIPLADLYLLGVLNSALLHFCLKGVCAALEGPGEAYLRFFGQYLSVLPIRPMDFSNPSDVAQHDRMVALVQTMLDLHERLPLAKTPRERDLLQRQIDDTDAALDQLVYELYELTDEEIAIVEGRE